jgi:hypothetical protein
MNVEGCPFIDNGEGFPTPDSVRSALNMYQLGALADTTASFRGEADSMVGLIARCRIEDLTKNWPKGFIAQVIGVAAQAGQQGSET